MDMRCNRSTDLEHLQAVAELRAVEPPAERSIAVGVSGRNHVLAAELREKGGSWRRRPGGRQRYDCYRRERRQARRRTEDPHTTSFHRFTSCGYLPGRPEEATAPADLPPGALHISVIQPLSA